MRAANLAVFGIVVTVVVNLALLAVLGITHPRALIAETVAYRRTLHLAFLVPFPFFRDRVVVAAVRFFRLVGVDGSSPARANFVTDTAPVFREAVKGDLPRIVELLAADSLGKGRERFSKPLPKAYSSAFEAITADPNNELTVACFEAEIVGVLQLTFIPYLHLSR